VFFRIMPNRPVPALAALMGALVTSALLKGLKASFAYYVDNLSSYNAIYGTLASIPVFLLLLYAVWVVILLGVCVTVFWGQKHGHPHSS
jgi:membrane protein